MTYIIQLTELRNRAEQEVAEHPDDEGAKWYLGEVKKQIGSAIGFICINCGEYEHLIHLRDAKTGDLMESWCPDCYESALADAL